MVVRTKGFSIILLLFGILFSISIFQIIFSEPRYIVCGSKMIKETGNWERILIMLFFSVGVFSCFLLSYVLWKNYLEINDNEITEKSTKKGSFSARWDEVEFIEITKGSEGGFDGTVFLKNNKKLSINSVFFDQEVTAVRNTFSKSL